MRISRHIGNTACLVAMTLAILSSAVAGDPASIDRRHDFRNADWGMSPEQVLSTENAKPAGVQRADGEVIIRFDLPESADLHGQLYYIFSSDRLVRGKYISTAEHKDLNDFVGDFAALEPLLTEKYDRPSSDRALWLSDLYQQERLPYLEQDRAHASDILPSDLNVGLSVSMGYLKMFTERVRGRTKVVHALTGADTRITHQVEYRSVEMDRGGDSALRQSTLQ